MTDASRAWLEPRTQRWAALRFFSTLLLLFGFIALLGGLLRPQLESTGRSFVERFGYVGMAVGTLLADGFHFPVPPQFYMLMSIASHASALRTLVSISVGSLLGGVAGFVLARKLGRLKWLQQRVASVSTVDELRARLGVKSMIALSISPVAFSWLIYFCGFSRYRWRFILLLCAFRVPKLLLYYWLVRAGWAL